VGDFKIERNERPAPVAVPIPAPEPVPLIARKAAAIAVAEAGPIPSEEAAPKEAVKIDREETPLASGSRLSGLRGLIFSLRPKKLNQAREAAPPEEETPSPMAGESGRTGMTRTVAPFSGPVPAAAASVETRAADVPSEHVEVVSVLPEFLPPKDFIPVKDGDRASESTSAARNDRRETYDDVRILPSRRGQYKTRP
jgi:hypothetical protein